MLVQIQGNATNRLERLVARAKRLVARTEKIKFMRKESKYNKSLIDLAEVLLEDSNTLSIRVSGSSMYPSLKEGDICYEQKCPVEDLKKGDIIARRKNNFFIMHRLKRLSKRPDGKYVIEMRGDNVLHYDPPFDEEEFVAKLLYFKRGGKIHQVDSPSMKFKKFIDDYFHPVSCRFNKSLLFTKYAFSVIRKQNSSLFTNLRQLIRGNQSQFRSNALIAVLKGIVPIGMLVSIKFLIDFLTHSSFGQPEQKLLFFALLGVTALLFLAGGVLTQIGNYTAEKMSQSVTRRVYDELHQKHIRLHLTDFENSAQLDRMHRAVQEASYRPVRILNSALGLIKTCSAGILLLALFVTIRWYLVIILLVAVLPEAVFRMAYSRKLYRMKEKQAPDEREKSYYNRVITGFPFAKEIRLFDFPDYFIRLFNRKQDRLFDEKLKLSRYELRTSILAQVFAVLLIFSTLGIVSYLSIAGIMTIGTVVLFFFAFQRGYSILNEFFRSVTSLVEDNSFLQDYLSFLQIPDVQLNKVISPKPFRLENEIRFDNVSFRYSESDREALRNVNIRIPAGKTVALVGENGAGKSTLVKLLCGFYRPTGGEILLDGVPAGEIGQVELLRGITAVFQDFALYQVSAADNILLGNYRKPRNMTQMKEAAAEAGIAETLEKLPQGYDTRLGHLFGESEELSIGQWQKMALARAFYRDAPLLLMDEPSSALDANAERQLIESLKALARNKTTLIVSHRLSTVQWADIIYLLHRGEVAETGTHEELIQLRGRYYRLFSKNENGVK